MLGIVLRQLRSLPRGKAEMQWLAKVCVLYIIYPYPLMSHASAQHEKNLVVYIAARY